MRQRLCVASVLLGATLVAACSLLVDTAGLSGQGDGADASGAASPGDARTPSDAPSTEDADAGAASHPDATSDADAGGGDADAATDAATAFSCPDASGTFCDDFDHDALGARWSSFEQKGGTVALDDGGVSPPNALRTGVLGGTNEYAYLVRVFPGAPPTHVRCDVDMELSTPPPPSGEVDVLALVTTGVAVNDYQLYLVHFGSGWAIGEYSGGSVDRTASIAALPIGRWMHLVFETDGSTLSLRVDGALYGTLPSLSNAAGTSRDLRLGLSFVANGISYTARYDNVLCTYGP